MLRNGTQKPFRSVFSFAFAVKYVIVQPEPHDCLRKRLSRNYLLLIQSELTFAFTGEFVEKIFRDDET